MLFQLISIFIVLEIDCIQVNESLIKKIRRRLLLKKKKKAELLELFKKNTKIRRQLHRAENLGEPEGRGKRRRRSRKEAVWGARWPRGGPGECL